ncbi:hypothetical protein [Paenibacillus sp. ISL-20]|uniref:hypothetical protein n=1 Tax=Paenibacillus sp. ISL-20 TaxID=2819163 RepID=UPI002034C669|nr:hypothetical protein [Paenibacillus sp. ISL-20]
MDAMLQAAYPELSIRVTNMGIGGNTVRELVRSALPGLQGFVIMTPFYLEPNAEDHMRSRMDEFGRAAKRVAEGAGALFVDTQAAFANHLDYVHPTALASDRVIDIHKQNYGFERHFFTENGRAA